MSVKNKNVRERISRIGGQHCKWTGCRWAAWRAGGEEAWQVEWWCVYFCLWLRRWAWQRVTSHMGGQLLGRHKGWFQAPVVGVRWMDVDLALLLYGRGLCCGGQLPEPADLWWFWGPPGARQDGCWPRMSTTDERMEGGITSWTFLPLVDGSVHRVLFWVVWHHIRRVNIWFNNSVRFLPYENNQRGWIEKRKGRNDVITF